jgi:hypothetical protein
MVGSYTIYAESLEYHLNSEMEFEEKTQNYLHRPSLHGLGIVVDDRRTSELLIDGKKDLNKSQFYFSIYNDEPYDLTSAEEKQTKRAIDFPR